MKPFSRKCPEVPRGNTETPGHNRQRWYPSFTSFLTAEPVWIPTKMKYLCYGAEVCPTSGRNHWQGCVYFFDKISIKQAQKLLGCDNQHMEINMWSDTETCVDYCKKDGNFKEFGILPAQGKRTDLESTAADLIAGTETVENIILTNPMMYHQYGRTLEKIEDIQLQKKWRTEMTKGIWYYGQTGVGKSHTAFANYHPDTVYSVPKDSQWWDGYKQQETVVINEFRGHIAYDEMLELVDKWPKSVPRRGKMPMPFTSKLVIVTSSLHPKYVYHNRNDRDDIQQLLRRFEIIELK